MPIPFVCPHCGAQTTVDERYAGQTGPCFQCGRTVTVPTAWAGCPARPASGSGASIVLIVVAVLLGLFVLLFCGGMMLFWVRAARTAAPPPIVVQSDAEDEEFLPGGLGPDGKMSEQDYASPAPHRFTRTRLKPASDSLSDALRAELAEAKAEGRRPYVEVGAAWSPPCAELNRNMDHPRMIDAFSGTYIIHLDVDDWADSPEIEPFRDDYLPAFYEIDPQGKPTGRKINARAWNGIRSDQMAARLRAFFKASPR
jgi:hypothetical protein